jgi:hypothetical protein
MGAGTIVAVLVILIIIGAAAFYFKDDLLKLLSGGDGDDNPNPPPIRPDEFKNDIITIDERSVSSTRPRVGGATTIAFNVNNNGDNDTNVEVNFFDVPGFKVISLYCDEVLSTDTICRFSGSNKIESLNSKRVSLQLQAPDGSVVTKETVFTVSYYVKYDYTGSRRASIPVIDGVTRTAPLSKYYASDSSYGPIAVDFDPPVGLETIVDSSTVKEYWIVGTNPFQLKMNFESVVSAPAGKVLRVNITSGSVSLDSKGTMGRVSTMPCDFDSSYKSTKSVAVPGSLICNFQADLGGQPEMMATADVNFKYTYQIIGSEKFTVQPQPKA